MKSPASDVLASPPARQRTQEASRPEAGREPDHLLLEALPRPRVPVRHGHRLVLVAEDPLARGALSRALTEQAGVLASNELESLVSKAA